MIVCEEILNQMTQQAIQNYPNEACGILIGAAKGNSITEFIPCENIYDQMHRKDPTTYPRTARTAFLIDPKVQQQIFEETSQQGSAVKAIFHSHTDHDAYFSEEDRAVAAPWGEPMFPGIAYIVISIWDGKFKEANEFSWDEKKKDFVSRKIG